MNILTRTTRQIGAYLAKQSQAVFGAFAGLGADGGPLSPMNSRWLAVPRSADADTVRSLPRQRGESRELARTNPIAVGAIATNINRVVGTGLQPVFAPDRNVLGWTEDQASEWKAIAAREFSLWADSPECDYAGEFNFYDRQAMVFGSRLESGDCFTVLPDGEATSTQPYRLRLQLLEADRIGNPMGATEGQPAPDGGVVVGGIRRNPVTGAPAACHIYRRHPGDVTSITRGDRFAGDWVEFFGATSRRRRVLHHYRPTRPEQSRGVPYLAPVIQAIKDLGRYTEAEITAAIISAFFTTFVETPQGTGPAPVFGLDGATGAGGEGANGDEIRLAAGAVIGLAPGEKISTANPGRPNPNAEAFLLGMIKLIAVGLNLPFELLLKSFNSSFSASKAALLDAWMHFRTERNWLVNSYCQPVLETWLTEAVAIGRIKAPGFFSDPLVRWAYTRATWHGDSQGSINPKDEVAAYLAAVDGNLMTQERAEWELFGTDWTRTFETKKREKAQVREAGMTPAPKAGAAAPAPHPEGSGADSSSDTNRPDPNAQAMQQLGAALQQANAVLLSLAQASKAQAEQVPAAVHVNVEAPEINVNAGDVHTHVAQAAPAAVEEVAAA
ncbi:MAG: hypothetical protein RL375_3355 [Pseudomonadota bacterium]|jgi:lambda family phage portal protein